MAVKIFFILMFLTIGVVLLDTLDGMILDFKSLYRNRKKYGYVICGIVGLGILTCCVLCYLVCML